MSTCTNDQVSKTHTDCWSPLCAPLRKGPGVQSHDTFTNKEGTDFTLPDEFLITAHHLIRQGSDA